MHLKKILSVSEYLTCFLKNCNNETANQQNIYRIVVVKKCTPEQIKLIVQIIGKSIAVEFTPQEVVANDQLLQGFSKTDIRTITWLACQQVSKPKYKIVMQEFCDGLKEILFKLKKRDSEEVVCKTAGQITLDKNLIKNLSQENVCCISYAAGYEQSLLNNSEKNVTQ